MKAEEEEEFRYIYTIPGTGIGIFSQPEPIGLPHKQFTSYLEYRGCELGPVLPSDVTFVRNPRNGTMASVPTRHYMVQRELIYHICLELGVNMPDEFQQFQQAMGLKPPGSNF